MRLILIICCSILLIVACDNNKVTIKGKIDNCPHQFVYLSIIDVPNPRVIDSCEISGNGKFKLKTSIVEPTFFQLHFIDGKSVTILSEQAESIEMHSDFQYFPDRYTITGSQGSIKIQRLAKRLSKTQYALDSLKLLYSELSQKAVHDSSVNAIAQQYQRIEKLQHDSTVRFIIENLHSMANIFAIYQKYTDGNYVLSQIKDVQYIKIVSDSLHKYYPKSNHVKALWTEREKLIDMINRAEIQAMINERMKQQDDSLKRKK